jgi:hypothetical protein
MPAEYNERGFQRRVIGYHGFRLDGLQDILSRCQDASVFDIGCNRGMNSYELALHGATLVHGVDNYETGVLVANEVFADWRSVQSQFEVADLSKGAKAVEMAFGVGLRDDYTFVLMLAVYHKLRRIMPLKDLLALVRFFADNCGEFFVWRGSREEKAEFEPQLSGFRLVHYSEMSEVMFDGRMTPQPAAVWKRI